METNWKHQVTTISPLGKLENTRWFHPKGNVMRYGFLDSLAWKPGGKLGFPTWKPGENDMETLGFQRKT